MQSKLWEVLDSDIVGVFWIQLFVESQRDGKRLVIESLAVRVGEEIALLSQPGRERDILGTG